VFLPYPVYTAPYSQVVEQTPSTVADRGSDLARELERLTDEVERLRDEQAARQQAQLTPAPRRPSGEENVPTTILVFRDGHRSEVRNYALVGQTLWVFTEQRAREDTCLRSRCGSHKESEFGPWCRGSAAMNYDIS